jgi:hypothetical protein
VIEIGHSSRFQPKDEKAARIAAEQAAVAEEITKAPESSKPKSSKPKSSKPKSSKPKSSKPKSSKPKSSAKKAGK